MVDIDRILCPTDFSDFSIRALRHASVLARWWKAEVTALHVMPGTSSTLDEFPPYLTPLPPDPLAREQAAARLTEFVRPAVEAGVRVRTEIREGEVVSQILREASQWSAGLIVIGTHGHGGFERLVLGSVTEKVLRKAACPVLTVPKDDGVLPSGSLFGSLVCALDFSRESVTAFEFAVALAESANARLGALYVLRWLAEEDPPASAHFNVPEYRAHLMHDARQRLQHVVDEHSGGRSVDVLVAAGKPYRQILRVAREREAGLVVLGVKGRGPMDLAFLGSTANHVVREAACPVVTVRTG